MKLLEGGRSFCRHPPLWPRKIPDDRIEGSAGGGGGLRYSILVKPPTCIRVSERKREEMGGTKLAVLLYFCCCCWERLFSAHLSAFRTKKFGGLALILFIFCPTGEGRGDGVEAKYK